MLQDLHRQTNRDRPRSRRACPRTCLRPLNCHVVTLVEVCTYNSAARRRSQSRAAGDSMKADIASGACNSSTRSTGARATRSTRVGCETLVQVSDDAFRHRVPLETFRMTSVEMRQANLYAVRTVHASGKSRFDVRIRSTQHASVVAAPAAHGRWRGRRISRDVSTRHRARSHSRFCECRAPHAGAGARPSHRFDPRRRHLGIDRRLRTRSRRVPMQVLEASFRAGGRNMTCATATRRTGYPQVCTFDNDPDLYFNAGPRAFRARTRPARLLQGTRR